jgi:hypothetical protein
MIADSHFRAFAVLDQWSRESLAIEVDVSLTGERNQGAGATAHHAWATASDSGR